MNGVTIIRNEADPRRFNPTASLPYQLRLKDFELAMQDVYDFFYDVNVLLASKGLQRLDDMLRVLQSIPERSCRISISMGTRIYSFR